MRILFLIVVIAVVNSSAIAHNPLTAKFELNATAPEGAFLSINLSQTGLHQALTKYFTDKDLPNMAENEYKKLAVNYLKKHITIKADDTFLQIGEGGIKLGSHQTDLKFLIENYPKEVNSLFVDVNTFKENENHHSAFWWKNKTGKSKVILSAKNNFKGNFNEIKNENVMFSFIEKTHLWIILGLSILMLYINIIRKIKIIATR